MKNPEHPEFSIREISKRKSAVERTLDAIEGRWSNNNKRISQGIRFVKKAIKSDKRRKQEKASRKRNRR